MPVCSVACSFCITNIWSWRLGYPGNYCRCPFILSWLSDLHFAFRISVVVLLLFFWTTTENFLYVFGWMLLLLQSGAVGSLVLVDRPISSVGVFRLSSKPSWKSFLSIFAFFIRFLAVCRARSTRPLLRGYLGDEVIYLDPHSLDNSANSWLLNSEPLSLTLPSVISQTTLSSNQL